MNTPILFFLNESDEDILLATDFGILRDFFSLCMAVVFGTLNCYFFSDQQSPFICEASKKHTYFGKPTSAFER